MFLCMTNFNLYFILMKGGFKSAFRDEEFGTMMILIVVNMFVISGIVFSAQVYQTFSDALRYGTFQVVATMSTTGYGTANILDWPLFSKVLLLGMMFIGGSAGSTSGGLKISRFVMLMKSGFKGIRSTAFPNRVLSIKMNGKPVSEDLINSTKNYFLLYTLIFVFSIGLVCLLPNGNNKFLDLAISVASCFNDIGPGVFGDLHWASKVILAFDMLAGRLELFPILLLLYPRAWSRF